jgi:ribosome biogenesis GTPase / thiamine phosphate phosphatase
MAHRRGHERDYGFACALSVTTLQEDFGLSDPVKRYLQHIEEARQRRLVRKQIKRTPSPKPVRHKDWLGDDEDDWEEGSESERVQPVGVAERRRQTLKSALAQLEHDDAGAGVAARQAEPGTEAGVVVQVSSGMCRVQCGDRTLLCRVNASLTDGQSGFTQPVCVGDQVQVKTDGVGAGSVQELLPRRSLLCRSDVALTHLRQPIAANAEQLLIVASWAEPPLWHELVDRYLIAALRNGLLPVVCLNKIDLSNDADACRQATEPYAALGYRVLLTSAKHGDGVEELRKLLTGRVTVVAGLSGVGKSSLLTSVEPGLQLKTGHISEFSGQGRHTTTQVTLWSLAAGGYVIDTPGIREFGLEGVTRSDLALYYPDLGAFSSACRFSNCTHRHEPDCAVRDAACQGRASPTRYHSYIKIYESLSA